MTVVNSAILITLDSLEGRQVWFKSDTYKQLYELDLCHYLVKKVNVKCVLSITCSKESDCVIVRILALPGHSSPASDGLNSN